MLKFVKVCEVVLLLWKGSRERIERKFCICLFRVHDDFCKKFVCATLFIVHAKIKRDEEEENLIEFFSKREKRDLVFRFILHSREENVYY